jgi:hypothetical protein
MAGIEADARPSRRLLQELTTATPKRCSVTFWRHRSHTRISQRGAAQQGTW